MLLRLLRCRLYVGEGFRRRISIEWGSFLYVDGFLVQNNRKQSWMADVVLEGKEFWHPPNKLWRGGYNFWINWMSYFLKYLIHFPGDSFSIFVWWSVSIRYDSKWMHSWAGIHSITFSASPSFPRSGRRPTKVTFVEVGGSLGGSSRRRGQLSEVIYFSAELRLICIIFTLNYIPWHPPWRAVWYHQNVVF